VDGWAASSCAWNMLNRLAVIFIAFVGLVNLLGVK
jgi:hypothetical protein